ncbi:BTB/POZ domain-containing protein At3g56230-like [Hibiscus syriacus]|uniref:BTB/POZ domain-containing protein At3g56230-like n=1 Tax=Hibiscus syriacus TaxID=106335 RepID=UPI001923D370|nr:BTB/POZ domain-containing protein At3g56230-like [Hibiscus syriacus]
MTSSSTGSCPKKIQRPTLLAGSTTAELPVPFPSRGNLTPEPPNTLTPTRISYFSCSRSPVHNCMDDDDDDEGEGLGSPTSTLCFGVKPKNLNGFKGCQSMMNVKKELLAMMNDFSSMNSLFKLIKIRCMLNFSGSAYATGSLSCPDPNSGSTFTPVSLPSRRNKSTVTTPANEKPLTDTEDDLKKRISFLSGFMVAFKEQIHTDIKLEPNDGPSISAHKSLLAARSEIFKNILSSDNYKAPPSNTDTITLPELNTEELKSLLEFLYTGDLPEDKFKRHVFTLYVAADKYEILYLQESCERYMMNSLNESNALDILEISDSHPNKKLKDTTLNFIVRNMKSIVSSQKYEVFASSNPHLSVEITRAFVDARI